MLARLASIFAIAAAGSLAATPAAAETFDLLSYPLTFSGGVVAATGKLTTGFHGTLSDEAGIEALLNSALYSADLVGPGGVLTNLDNSNSHWDVVFGGAGPSMSLNIDATGIHLSFSTLAEFSEARLFLRSLDGLSLLQYSQFNNNSDFSSVNFSFNAVFNASYFPPYGSTITMPLSVAAIPEPEVLASLALGLVLMRWTVRRRRRDD